MVSNAADFRLITARVKAEIPHGGGGEKLLRAIIPSLGFHQVNIEYRQEKRFAGSPAYSYADSYELAIRTIFNFSRFPAHFVFLSGIILIFLGLSAALYDCLFMMNFLFALLLIVGGIIVTSAGCVCWYLYFILERIKGEAPFIIQKVVLPRNENP